MGGTVSLVFVQGDTAPSIEATIHLEDDPTTVVDLSPGNVTGVKFQMRKADDRKFTVNTTATIVNGPNGTVRYDWGANDLATPGAYLAQWEITYVGGRIQTTAPEVALTIRRQ
jgi:hypothetical protein